MASRFTGRVVVRPWAGYAAQKNFAASLCAHDWILSLDADERVTPELACGDPRDPCRRSSTWRLPDSESGLPPRTVDSHDRLVSRTISSACTIGAPRAGRARTSTSRSRSPAALDACRNELQHFPYRDVSDHLETIDRYTTLAAREMNAKGRRSGLLKIGAHPPLAFLRNYLLRGGFRDGVPGLIISALNAYYVFLKFSKLWQIQHATGATEHSTGATEHPTGSAEHSTGATTPVMFSLHIDTARTWRGGQNQVLLTVNGLREIGHRAALVAHPDGELRRRASEGLELIPIAPRTEMDLSAAWRLARVLKRLRPDVVHAHDPHGIAMASLALSFAGRRRRPDR